MVRMGSRRADRLGREESSGLAAWPTTDERPVLKIKRPNNEPDIE